MRSRGSFLNSGALDKPIAIGMSASIRPALSADVNHFVAFETATEKEWLNTMKPKRRPSASSKTKASPPLPRRRIRSARESQSGQRDLLSCIHSSL